jgi:hypothetical protein
MRFVQIADTGTHAVSSDKDNELLFRAKYRGDVPRPIPLSVGDQVVNGFIVGLHYDLVISRHRGFGILVQDLELYSTPGATSLLYRTFSHLEENWDFEPKDKTMLLLLLSC